jgi:DNA polymerase-1
MTEKKKPTLYLIDGSNYVYRAFFAIQGLTNSRGVPTNAVFGFNNMLAKLLRDRKPEHIAVVFDAKGPRSAMRPSKTTRPTASRCPMS